MVPDTTCYLMDPLVLFGEGTCFYPLKVAGKNGNWEFNFSHA